MKSLIPLPIILLAGWINTANAAAPSLYACFDATGSMVNNGEFEWNSMGTCHGQCTKGSGYNAMAMSNNTCYCGNNFPPKSDKVDSSKCTQGCPGFGPDQCGDRLGKYFSVYLTGLVEINAVDFDPSPSSSTSASKTSSTSSSATTSSTSATTTSSPPATTTATSGADQTSSAKPSATSSPKSSINTAAVAAGAVIGVLGAIAISVGSFLFLRNKRRQKIEDEYRRSAAVREFTQKPGSDHRLDPSMMQRRDSVGSIADNQDYSRRILKVTNPDGT